MGTTPASKPSTNFTARHVPEILAALAVLVVLQIGLVPFDFSTGAAPSGQRAYFSTAFEETPRPDIIANILLYSPLGLLLTLTIRRRGVRAGSAWLLAAAAGTMLSAVVEYAQAYSPPRVSSLIDLAANAAGAGLGAWIAVAAASVWPKLLGAALYELRVRPRVIVLKAYVVVLVAAAAMPFTFSFDTTRLGHALERAYVVPFASVQTHASAADSARAVQDSHRYAMARWRLLKCYSRWLLECASFAVLAWLALPVFLKDFGFSGWATSALIAWLCATLAIGLSLLQLPIVARGWDTTDILARLLGVALGLAAAALTRGAHVFNGHVGSARDRNARARALCWIGTATMGAYVIYIGLIPFVFDSAAVEPIRAARSTGFLSLSGYFATRFDLILDDVLEKLAAYALFAALLSAVWTRAAQDSRTKPIVRACGVGLALALSIEIVQAYIPVRTPDVIDLILALCGCAAGGLLQAEGVALYRFARSHEMTGPLAPPAGARPALPLSPTEALIATLTDPYPEAPREPAPGPPKPISRNSQGTDE